MKCINCGGYKRNPNGEKNYLPSKPSPGDNLLPGYPLVEEIPKNQPLIPRATFDVMLSGNFPLIRVSEGGSWKIKPKVTQTMSQLITKEGIANPDRWYDLFAACGTSATLYVMDTHGERYRVVDIDIDYGGETGQLILQHLGRRSRGGNLMLIDIWEAYGKMLPFVVYKDR